MWVSMGRGAGSGLWYSSEPSEPPSPAPLHAEARGSVGSAAGSGSGPDSGASPARRAAGTVPPLRIRLVPRDVEKEQ